MSSVIEFRNVTKVYNNGTEALHNVNLKVEKGEFVFIVGSSGAGKSTFLKLITCEERPNAGQIIVAGEDVTHIRKRKIPYVRRKMGMVFQDFRLIDHMTVYDNVAFAMRVVGASGRSIKKRVPYILSLVGLQHKAKHRPNELSGGERQRVGLARALVNNPSLIIADEPTGNIDPALSFEIVDLLSEINRRGATILMVTHEHSLVKHFHKRIIQIHSGEIVADTAAVVQEPEQNFEAPSEVQEMEDISSAIDETEVKTNTIEDIDLGETIELDSESIAAIDGDELAAAATGEMQFEDISSDFLGNTEAEYDEEFIIDEDGSVTK